MSRWNWNVFLRKRDKGQMHFPNTTNIFGNLNQHILKLNHIHYQDCHDVVVNGLFFPYDKHQIAFPFKKIEPVDFDLANFCFFGGPNIFNCVRVISLWASICKILLTFSTKNLRMQWKSTALEWVFCVLWELGQQQLESASSLNLFKTNCQQFKVTFLFKSNTTFESQTIVDF